MDWKHFPGKKLYTKFHATIAQTVLKTVMYCFIWKIPAVVTEAKQIQEGKRPLQLAESVKYRGWVFWLQ